MKKLSLFMAALMVSAMTMAAWTDLSASFDATTKKAGESAYNKQLVYDGWTVVNGANYNKQWAYFKMGGKSATLASANPCYISSSKITESVDSITVHLPAGSLSKTEMSVNSWAVCVYSDSMTTLVDSVIGGTITKNEGFFGFKPSTGVTWAKNYYYKVTWNLANTSATNGIVWVDKITLHKNVITTDPTITAGKVEMGTYMVGISAAKNLSVVGENLTEAITYAWEKGGLFSATGSLTTTGGTLSIDVIANADTLAVDSLVLTSGNATKKVSVTANVIVTVGDGTKENPFTIVDVQKMKNTIKQNAWVVGYIAGSAANGGKIATKNDSTSLLLVEAMTDSIGVPVALVGKTDARRNLNIVDHPENKGAQVKVYGSLEAYFGVAGMKNTSDYEIVSPATALVETMKKVHARKAMLNGQMVIVRDGKMFNALGAEL